MTIRLPDTVRVGPHIYEVAVETEPFVSDDQRTILCGEANHDAGRIRVLRSLPTRMFVTFWHEVLHAVDDMAGTELSEDQVNRLAPILAGVLMDNGYADRADTGETG